MSECQNVRNLALRKPNKQVPRKFADFTHTINNVAMEIDVNVNISKCGNASSTTKKNNVKPM